MEETNPTCCSDIIGTYTTNPDGTPRDAKNGADFGIANAPSALPNLGAVIDAARQSAILYGQLARVLALNSGLDIERLDQWLSGE